MFQIWFYISIRVKCGSQIGGDLKDISNELNKPYIYISAVSRQGADKFIQRIEQELDQQRT